MADNYRTNPYFADMSHPGAHRTCLVEQCPLSIRVDVDMPGLKQEHVSTRLDGAHLVITGDGPLDPHEHDRRRFRAVVKLPAARENLVDKAVRFMHDGVYTVCFLSVIKSNMGDDEEAVIVEYTPRKKTKVFTTADGSFYARFDIAGLKREQVKVVRNGNQLMVEGIDKRADEAEPRRKFLNVLIVSGLSELGEMKDKMEDGVLNLFFPKKN